MREDCRPFAVPGAEPISGFNGLWGHLLEMWETAGRMRGSRRGTKGPAVPRHRHRHRGHHGSHGRCEPRNGSDQSEQTAP